jgi:hypothetical protein
MALIEQRLTRDKSCSEVFNEGGDSRVDQISRHANSGDSKKWAEGTPGNGICSEGEVVIAVQPNESLPCPACHFHRTVADIATDMVVLHAVFG